MNLRDLLCFVPFIAFGVTANLLIKNGISRLNIDKIFTVDSFLSLGASPYILAGIFCYGMGFLGYIYVLHKFPLHIVQTFSALAVIAVILASRFILKEPISVTRWIGIVLVFAGLILVGRST